MDGETPEDREENDIMNESNHNEKKKKHKKRKHRKGKDGDSDSEKKTIDKKNPAMIKDLIADCFVLLHIIGKGSFGQIYISYNMRDNLPVSVKKEEKKPGKTPQLKTESKIYQTLLNIQSDDISGTKPLGQDDVTGVPKFYGVGELPDCYYMIIDFLGPNLIELFNYCGCKKFTVSTVCLIALQVLNRIENLHKHHYLHRDIKPENFLIGIHEKSNVIYLIDFGLSKRYKNLKTHQHIPYREGRALTGTARYVSINTHMGIEQSRRDDLESIGYMLIYFLKGVLPWQGLKNGNEKYTRIMEKKLQIPTEILCYGLPDEITYYLKYCKSLRFEDRPDYDYLRGLFIKLLGTCNSVYGLTKEMLKFDWCFEDPASSIWNIFNKKNKNLNESKYGSNLTNKEKNEEEEVVNKKKNEGIKLKKQLSNIAEVNDFISNENNPNYERSSESGDSHKSDKAKEKNKKDILDKNLIKEEEGESKLDESEETVRENFQPEPQDLEAGKLSESLKNILQGLPEEDNIDKYMNTLMNPAKPPIPQGENLINLDEVEIINNNNSNQKEEKKADKNINAGSLGSIKEESNKKELISSSNKASGEKNKEKEKEKEEEKQSKQSVQVDKIKNNQSESLLLEDDKDKEKENQNSDENKNDKKSKELISSQNLIVSENINDKDKLESININSKNMSKHMGEKLDQMNNKENKLTFEQMDNIDKNINIKDTEEKKEEPKNEIISNSEQKNTNNINNINNEVPKSFENKISEHNSKDLRQQNKEGTIRQSKSNKLLKSINEKIKEEEKESKEKNNKNKDEENHGYTKNFKTMKAPKKNNNDKDRKSLTPFGDTPMGDSVPKMKVSKENLIKISTEPVANFYSIVKDLGHGSYGQVKKVKHKELNEIRAMKITNKKSESSKYEIEILKKISHPNITKIFEIFADSKKYYIIMEFLEGGELFEAITNIGSFTEASASKVMKQILSAVVYLHSNHIVHRDLKPENIMLTQKPKNGNYQIKLIDFGTAKIFRPGKKMNKFIGTSYYIAPEVLKERYDEKCDVWSCGVILFILLCGYPPFNGNTNVDIFHAIQNQNPIFGGEEWEDITQEAKDLIKLMLKKNPSERLSAEQCLTHKWFKIMESSDRNKSQRISKQIQINAIQHMAQFVHENRFKQAVLQFISTQFNIQREENDLKELFKTMDVTGTGQLTKDEFTKKLMELYGENDGKEMAEGIFNSLDMDGSGKISYDEFLSAMINSQKVVTEERLKKAFRMFDKDNSGKLSVKEIRNVFGGTEEQWKMVINEVDLNNDGEVDFEEFKIMMANMDKNQIIERKKSSVKSKGVSEVD